MGDVFILGAGFSRAVSEHMPLLGDLGRAVRQKLELPESDALFGGDVELWLTYLSQSHPWLSEAENLRNRALFVDVSRAIADAITERTQPAVAGPCPAWLHDLTYWWHRHRATVVTLNYDTLVERAAGRVDLNERPYRGECRIDCASLYPIPLVLAGHRLTANYFRSNPRALGLPSPHGGCVATFDLCKLHGSVNWHYSGASSFQGETVCYTPVPGWWDTSDLSDEHLYQWNVRDKVPLIAPPLTEKLPYFQHETIRSTWTHAARALQDAERVFCIGYSLPKTDITMRFFLEGNCRKGARLHVVNRDPGALAHYESVLGHCYQVDGTYVTDDPLRLLVRDLTDEGSGE